MTVDAAFTHFPSLTTRRLLLRQIVLGDAEGLFAIRSDEETMKFFGHEPHATLDETKDVVRQLEERYVRKAALHWVIALQGDERLIGACNLFHFDEGIHCAETGYEQLERLADLSHPTVRDIFRDPYKEVTTTTLTKLATALGVSVSDLFEEVSDERTD